MKQMLFLGATIRDMMSINMINQVIPTEKFYSIRSLCVSMKIEKC